MQIKISVVIPTYKRPELLLKCLNALTVQNLNHSNFEVIVVSDGPDLVTERALNYWITKRKLNLRYLHTTEKAGPAAARNLGWMQAKADLIAFTDDDCIPDSGWLAAFIINYNRQEYIAFTGKTIVPLTHAPSDFAVNTSNLQDAEFITANCACTRKSLVLVGGFDERFKLAWREDSDLQFRLLIHEVPIISLNKAKVIHPVRSAPWGISIREQRKSAYDALIFKKYPMLYKAKLQQYPLWNYYITILLWLLLLLFTIAHSITGIIVAAVLLTTVISLFIFKRLKGTSKSVSHITEMMFTSLLIPFLSVYWRIYGGIKFNVFFI